MASGLLTALLILLLLYISYHIIAVSLSMLKKKLPPKAKPVKPTPEYILLRPRTAPIPPPDTGKYIPLSELGVKYEEPPEEEDIYLPLKEVSLNRKLWVHMKSIRDKYEVKPLLNLIREGETLIMLNVGPVKDKDEEGYKSAIRKIKISADAAGSTMYSLSDGTLVIVPPTARMHKENK